MNVIETEIQDVKIIEPKILGDSRGYFFESYNENTFQEKVKNTQFIQDNESKSTFGVLRGLHYQLPPYAQSKLVRVVQGEVLDVAVDIRKKSPTFMKWVSVILNEDNKKQLYIPKEFAHGFVVLSSKVLFQYKVDNKYSYEHERGIKFDDKKLGIDWILSNDDLKLSEKDKNLPAFSENFNYF